MLLVEGDKALFNPYGVIAVNPAKNPNIHNDLANQFIDWIISSAHPGEDRTIWYG